MHLVGRAYQIANQSLANSMERGMDRPAFRRHLRPVIYGNRGGQHERQGNFTSRDSELKIDLVDDEK